ncbi:MAG: sugar isomerase [Clostridia bacterium]|nr:sugar isomerase [Clostridia bacterium]
MSSINSLVSYLALLEAGVGTATIQALYGPIARSEKNKINGILSATNRFYNRTGLIYAVIIIALASFYPLVVPSALPYLLQTAIIILVGAGGVLGYLFQAKFKLLLQAEGKQYVITNITTIIHVATSVGKLVFISVGLTVIWLQVFQFALVLVQIICYYSYIHKHYKWIDLKVSPDEKAISQKNSVLVHQISEMVFNHVDVVLLTVIIRDLKVVSVYVLYNTFVDMISTLIGNVNNGFIFRLGQLYNTDEERHKKVFDTYETFYMAFSFALYAVTYMFLHPFMKLYTSGVTDTDYMLPLLPLFFVMYKLLICARGACGSLASYAGHFKQTRIHSVIETSINLFFSIGAVIVCQKLWGLGIYGVLIGTIAALLFRANIMIIYANRHILFRSCWRTYSKWVIDVVIAVICCGAYAIISPEINNYFHLILYAAIAGISVLIIYFGINALLRLDDTKYLLKHIKTLIRKKS